MSGSMLDRARTGDGRAFRELTAPYLGELRLHCYRMLGSLPDAEDALQETMVAAWRGIGEFAGRSSLRTWLYQIATNRCRNAIRDSRRRIPAEPVPPFDPPAPSRRAEVTWLQPCPDAWLAQSADPAPGPAARYHARESVELAFVAALQRLPPRQTAVLILCDVLGFPAGQVSGMLGATPAAVKGALQRARAGLRRAGAAPGQAGAPAADSPQERALARRFAAAFTADDIDGVVALLTDDAWLAMPPAPHEYHGPPAIAAFLRASAGWRAPRRFVLVPTRANTQPAFGCYLPGPGRPTPEPFGLLVLTLAGDRIAGITRFLDRGLPAQFGLPAPPGQDHALADHTPAEPHPGGTTPRRNHTPAEPHPGGTTPRRNHTPAEPHPGGLRPPLPGNGQPPPAHRPATVCWRMPGWKRAHTQP